MSTEPNPIGSAANAAGALSAAEDLRTTDPARATVMAHVGIAHSLLAVAEQLDRIADTANPVASLPTTEPAQDPDFASLQAVLDGPDRLAAEVAEALRETLSPIDVAAICRAKAWPRLVQTADSVAARLDSSARGVIRRLSNQFLAAAGLRPDPAAFLAEKVRDM